MQISSTPTAYGGGEAQRLLNLLLRPQGVGDGQDLPGAGSTPADGPPPPQPSANPAAMRFASKTLASLLSAQEAPPSSADIAAKVIGTADADGDGSLSLDEVEKALGQATASNADALGQAFAKVDSDGDGQISAAELTSALDAKTATSGAQHAHHGRHAHAAAPSSADLASRLLGEADSDGDGELSAGEIQTALGATASDSLSSAIGGLDADGDGKLSASELSTAIDAFRTAHRHGATAQTATSSGPAVSA